MAQNLGVYNLARPVPSFLGQLGDMQQLETNQQQQQMNALAIQDRQRQMQQQQQAQRVQQTINEIAKQSVKPDGTVDRQKLRSGLTNAGLFNVVPDIEETLTKVEKAQADLRESLSKANASEDERIAAAMGLGKASAYTPSVPAEAVKGMIRQGAISPERGQRVLAELQSAQTPEDAKALIDRYVSTSKAQADIARTQAETAESGEDLDDKRATREAKTSATALANASKQLYTAAARDRSGQQYAVVYRGLSPEIQKAFDAPEAYDPAGTPERTLQASMTPDQITQRKETAVRDAEQAKRDRAQEERNRIMDENLRLSRADAARHRRWLETHGDQGDPAYKRDFEEYKTFLGKAEPSYSAQLEAWKAQHPYPVPDEQGNFPAPPAYAPPPDFESWRTAKTGRQASSASTSSKSPVKMRAPNGQIAMVPADQVEAAKKKGAKVVP